MTAHFIINALAEAHRTKHQLCSCDFFFAHIFKHLSYDQFIVSEARKILAVYFRRIKERTAVMISAAYRFDAVFLSLEKALDTTKHKPVCDPDDLLDRLLLAFLDPLPVNAKDRIIDEVHKHCLLIFRQCAVFF